MIETILAGWWKVLALMAGALVFFGGITLLVVHFLKKAKESGVDEIDAGPVKLDFDKTDDK